MMTEQEVLAKVQHILRELFNDDTLVITADTVAADVEEWDSLEHVNIINRIEKVFSVKFTMKETAKFRNVGDMVNVIISKL